MVTPDYLNWIIIVLIIFIFNRCDNIIAEKIGQRGQLNDVTLKSVFLCDLLMINKHICMTYVVLI